MVLNRLELITEHSTATCFLLCNYTNYDNGYENVKQFVWLFADGRKPFPIAHGKTTEGSFLEVNISVHICFP